MMATTSVACSPRTPHMRRDCWFSKPFDPGVHPRNDRGERVDPGTERLHPGVERFHPGIRALHKCVDPGAERLHPGTEHVYPGAELRHHVLTRRGHDLFRHSIGTLGVVEDREEHPKEFPVPLRWRLP